MRIYSAQEIQAELQVTAGTPEEQAAALAVVEMAILESRRLGRIAVRKPKTSWSRTDNLRKPLQGGWRSQTRT